MASKKNRKNANTDRETGKNTAEYYRLNTKAVDDLVDAN